MKKIATLLIALSFFIASNAQEHPIIDTLKNKLYLSSDTTKAILAFQIANYYMRYHSSMDSIQTYIDLGLQYSERYHFEPGRNRYHFLSGQMYLQQEDYGAALQAFQKAEEIVAIDNNQRALSMIYNAQGAVYAAMEDYEKANENYVKAAQIGESIGLSKLLASIYSNLSIINTRGKYFERSLMYDHKALSVLQGDLNKEDSLVLVTTLLNTAATFKNLGKLDSARIYNDQATDLANFMAYDRGLKRAFNSRMVIELAAKNYAQVLAYADRLTERLANYPSAKSDCSVASSVPYYRSLAYHHLGQHSEAIKQAHLTMEQAGECGIAITYNALHALIEAYKGAEQYETAFEYQEQYNEVEDSITSTSNKTKIQALQSLYESEKKERKLAELNQQMSMQSLQIKQRNFLILGIVAVALLAIFSIYLFSQQRILKNKRIASEAEQRLLRLQMNPHFLFNALSSIQTFLFDKKDTTKAVGYLSRFAELMRQILEYSRETYITLEDEIRTLENYLSLQQLRHNHEFDYEIEVAKGLNRWETLIPPLMAQPFVENAIEHGKVHSVANGKISIRFLADGKHLKLLVEDNGIGREQALRLDSKKKYKSLATAITRDRVQLLSQIAQRKFSFEVKDLPQRGTQVIFQFPLME
ncbi:MAG: histidine kinase [Bacteroidota bacterium]